MEESIQNQQSTLESRAEEQEEKNALVQSSTEERRDEPPEIAGSVSTRIKYTLRFTGPPSLSQLVAVAVATAVYTVLSWLTLIGLPSPFFGVSSIFIGIGFGIPFAIWFGGWAFVIAYIGNFVGAGLLTGTPFLVALPFGAADLIQLGLPMLLYRLFANRFGVSPIGKDVYTVRGFIFFLICAVIPNNVIGGLYGNFILVAGGLNKPELLVPGWFTWSISNMIVTAVIGSILLATLGPVVERFGLTIRNLFN
ncbi:hypothetical protein EPA93_47305 [Ktedonosporobacter rubrisoli]|uniref:ECF transporter S component n=1 Tax=Ktedonosporobacter rubrisoli TaxID=2509675 RepID=A0A4P6K4D0_KTERU|nr:hypothetical protein [Ktedonosporobacter rubrisoli]QBD83168.1 hypothetical protein EPA93_47305 [Ktedonosporobacter rubrisoli]